MATLYPFSQRTAERLRAKTTRRVLGRARFIQRALSLVTGK